MASTYGCFGTRGPIACRSPSRTSVFGGSLVFEVDAADALTAFHHPYAYANPDRTGHALAA
jgi:hypothetical protein